MDLYKSLCAIGAKIANHESDLYVKDTPQVREILKAHGRAIDGHNVQPFRSQIDGTPWLDVPFAYTPFWDAKAR